MKNIFRLLLTLLLTVSLMLGATSCEVVESFIGDYISGDTDTVTGDLGDTDTDIGDSGDTDTDTGDSGDTDTDIGDSDVTVLDGGIILLPNEADPVTADPYVGVDKDEFYENYTPAISYMDAYYRTQHGLMSGSIDEQDQEPTVSSYQPILDGLFVRNTSYVFSEDRNTYYVLNAHGEIVNEIYRGAAYVTLEEVAAYVFAFGEPPANHSYSKRTRPTDSVWGMYLRVNHSKFSGDVDKYPYEPVLPDIYGCGGDLFYYEMDIGTTGTDCDPSYEVTDYNDGKKITRGAARIVYTRYDLDGDGVIEVDEVYLFYTYNHYNDFQEYLNYEGGWGRMFGNITGGGALSSDTDYSPTPYVPTAYAAFYGAEDLSVISVVIVAMPIRRETI